MLLPSLFPEAQFIFAKSAFRILSHFLLFLLVSVDVQRSLVLYLISLKDRDVSFSIFLRQNYQYYNNKNSRHKMAAVWTESRSARWPLLPALAPAGDLFYRDSRKLLPVYWSRTLSQCPPVLTDIKVQIYTHKHTRTHTLRHTSLSFISCQGVKSTTLMFFPYTRAHFKHMWETGVRDQQLLNTHERPVCSLMAWRGC